MEHAFKNILPDQGLKRYAHVLHDVSSSRVLQILQKESIAQDDFFILLSEAAQPHLERMAQRAQQITVDNFGKTIGLYAPLYISNFCENECLYCGFNRANTIVRKKLKPEEVAQEARVIAQSGIQHLLLLTGESRQQSPLTYIKECVRQLRDHFASIAVEIYPLSTEEYKELVQEEVDGLTIYQETYDSTLYAKLHPRGPKQDYQFRLDAPMRGCAAGMRQVTIGVLLGLGDWRFDVFCVGLHALWLQRHYPEVEIGVALPRLQKHIGDFSGCCPVSDREFVQILLALRLLLPRASISLSTRETQTLRANLIGLGVTRMSAGSHTEVGGYALSEKTEGQFAIADESSVTQVMQMIRARGYQPVLKDWF
ncbi:MAG: 2-iminoacetate synthase ThiH [Candidatus Omnitrophica bacterium]|nr:2-iminoacetate synthase ThiH [Candidatus Omnitrophota bacterium]